jgi:hypothetical protein
MRRLRRGNRLLTAVLLALGARVVIAGLTFASGLSAGVVGALLLTSLLLPQYGHRLEPAAGQPVERDQLQPPPRPTTPEPSRRSRPRRGRRRR